jgi:trk system potassium uptake protein TrkA
MGKQKQKLNKIVIIGGGTIGSYVAKSLLAKTPENDALVGKFSNVLGIRKKKKNIYIIDRNYERCKKLSEDFPDALVLNADISDEDVFDEELLNTDLLIATTEKQELNIVTAIYSKTMGVKRTIALVNNINYINVASNLGIDVPVSLKTNLVKTILKYIRRTNVKNVYSISGGKIEVIEVYVEESSKANGRRIRDLRLPHQSLIISISRGRENIVPDGDFVLQKGDYLILIVKKEFIKTIEQLF